MFLKNVLITAALGTMATILTTPVGAIESQKLGPLHNIINYDDNNESQLDVLDQFIPRGTNHGMRLATRASWYGSDFYGNYTACGQKYNSTMVSAAHKSLPCGTRVMVTNEYNGRSVVVTINDRGPFIPGRVLDLSNAAADILDMKHSGVVPITMDILN